MKIHSLKTGCNIHQLFDNQNISSIHAFDHTFYHKVARFRIDYIPFHDNHDSNLAGEDQNHEDGAL